MALLPIHRYFIIDGKLKKVNEFIPSENDGGIYEVLRVSDGVPLFLNEHIQRLYHSARIAGKKIAFTSEEIKLFLELLISKNKVEFGNILISIKSKLKVFFIPHNYPTKEQYSTGVTCGVLHAERTAPNAKVYQSSVRIKANELIAENAFYEVLLVDNHGKITEGSRSNVFFVKGNRIVTPVAQKVLLGITRQKVIECAKLLAYPVYEEEVSFDDLTIYDAVFLTGTSPKVLPLKCIGSTNFEVNNKVVRNLMERFSEFIDDYKKNARL